MTTPRRILDDQPSAKVRLLLSSVQVDAPPEDGEDRLLAALGLAGGIGAAATTTTVAASSAGAFGTNRLARLAKTVCLGTAVLGAIAVGALVLRTGRPTDSVSPGSPPALTEAALRPSQESASLPGLGPGSAADPSPPARPGAPGRPGRPLRRNPSAAAVGASPGDGQPADNAASPFPAGNSPAGNFPVNGTPAGNTTVSNGPPAPATVSAPLAAPPSPPRQLKDYEALLRARRALGVPKNALALLDAFHRDFPESRLAPEAAVLRIQALAADGQEEEACQKGKQFLANYPKMTLATTVQPIVDRLCAPSQRDLDR